MCVCPKDDVEYVMTASDDAVVQDRYEVATQHVDSLATRYARLQADIAIAATHPAIPTVPDDDDTDTEAGDPPAKHARHDMNSP